MGATSDLLKKELENSIPKEEFTFAWTPEDIDQALYGRVQVIEALANVGVLYGAPHGKLYEMATEGESNLSSRVAVRTRKYGDGLKSHSKERPSGYVRMLCPLRLRTRLLGALPIEMTGERDLMEISTVRIDDKPVECLIAWLPSLRNMLLRTMRNPDFNSMLNRCLETQSLAMANMLSSKYRNCFEIIDPEGVMMIGDIYSSSAAHMGSEFVENAVIGMLLGTYDADSVIAHMLSLRDWRKCREWQEQWHQLVIKSLDAKKNIIVHRSGWSDKLLAGDQLQQDISKVGNSGSRLLRFILEQAGANFSKMALQIGSNMGFGNAVWPEKCDVAQDILTQMTQPAKGLWPVVGIRMDFLVTRQASLLRKHLTVQYGKDKEMQRETKAYWDDYEANNTSDFEDHGNRDYDPFFDDED